MQPARESWRNGGTMRMKRWMSLLLCAALLAALAIPAAAEEAGADTRE